MTVTEGMPNHRALVVTIPNRVMKEPQNCLLQIKKTVDSAGAGGRIR
jgi:hypothetical protein